MAVFHQIRSLLTAIILCIIGVSQASADLCRDILSVREDHQVLTSAVTVARGGPLSSDDFALLDKIINTAQQLNQYDLRDPALARAVARYVGQIDQIRMAHNFRDSPSMTRLSQSASFQSSIDAVNATGRDFCANATDRTASGTTTSTGTIGGLTALSWAIAVPSGLLLVGTLIGGTLIWFRFTQKSLAQKQRYDCNVAITVVMHDVHVKTRMIDVSAVGGKIVVPSGAVLDQITSISIDEKSYPCTKTWENTHFAGVQFNPPLQLRHVQEWSVRRQKKQVAKTTANVT